MAATSLPDSFQKSYIARASYPRNLPALQRHISWSQDTLDLYQVKLDAATPTLFESEPRQNEPNLLSVHFREFLLDDGAGRALDKYEVASATRLNTWLGAQEALGNQQPPQTVVTVSRKDPKCRFIYIWGKTSRSRLRITRPMLEQILTFHQVMPEYLDSMLLFGLKDAANGVLFSNFRTHTALRAAYAARAEVAALARSGRQYQMSYNLRGVTFKSEVVDDPSLNEYSIRQAAFYHKFDVVGGNTLWIVTKGGEDVRERFKDMTGKDGRPEDKAFNTVEECFRSSLSAHLLFCYWSTEDWLRYINWLESTIGHETVMAVLGPRSTEHVTFYTDRDIQVIQMWIEKVANAVAVLEGNSEVLSSLSSFYENLLKNTDFPLRMSCKSDIDEFIVELDSISTGFKMHLARLRSLLVMAKDRKELVKLHYEKQSAQRLESMTVHMEREAIVVRIITIVTLIYLPATFVSTFFSTDVIKYQDTPETGGSFSDIAMNRWLQVSLPLMFVTFVLSWLGYMWSRRFIQARERQAKEKGPKQPTFWSQARSKLPRYHRSPTASIPLLPMQNPSQNVGSAGIAGTAGTGP